MSIINYAQKAKEARRAVLGLIYKSQKSHLASNFSCIDLLTVLFEKVNIQEDKLFVSKGWIAASILYFLSQKGIVNWNEVWNRYCQPGEKEFIGLIEPQGRFAQEFAGGSMGMGLSAGVSRAWSKKERGQSGIIHVLESDGGMQVGINWEALWFADQNKLDNIILWIDKNDFQAMGPTKDILNMEKLSEKLKAFGCEVAEIDGHNFREIENIFDIRRNKILAVIAQTVKGKGWRRAEGSSLFHYKSPSPTEFEEAMLELA